MSRGAMRRPGTGQPNTEAQARSGRCCVSGGLLFLFVSAMLFVGSSQTQAAVLDASIAAVHSIPGDVRERVLREMTDPCLGLHWQLVVNSAHPGWPARMVLLEPNGREATNRAFDSGRTKSTSPDGSPADAGAAGKVEIARRISAAQKLPTVIQAGDQITLDQDSSVVTARLQAVALESARAEQPLRVRLIVNVDRQFGSNSVLTSRGPILTVVATGNHRAHWDGSGRAEISGGSKWNER